MGRPRTEGERPTWPPPVWRGSNRPGLQMWRASPTKPRAVSRRGMPGRPGWLLISQPDHRRRVAVHEYCSCGIIIPAQRIRVWSTYEINAARVLGATVGRALSQREGAERGDGRGGTGSERSNNILRAAIKVLIWTVHLVLGICDVPQLSVLYSVVRYTYIRIFGFCAVDMGCIIRNRSG